MKDYKYDETTDQYFWVLKKNKTSTYSNGDTKEGWPVYLPPKGRFDTVYRNIKRHVRWKAAAVRMHSDSKRNRYKGSPLNKDTRDEILRNESDNLLLYKLSPKPTPAPKNKRKNEASDDRTNHD